MHRTRIISRRLFAVVQQVGSRRLTGVALIALITLSPVTASYGASFDCQKAQSYRERTVCSNDELSALDEDLGQAYALARAGSADPTALKATQKAWLASANQCADAACLVDAYRQRIAEIKPADPAVETPQAAPQTASPSPAASSTSEPISPQSSAAALPPVSAKIRPTKAQSAPEQSLLTPKLILEISAGLLIVLIGSAFYFHAHHFDQSGHEKKTYWVRFGFMYAFWVATGVFWLTVGILKFVLSAMLSGRGGSPGHSSGPVTRSKASISYRIYVMAGNFEQPAAGWTSKSQAIQDAQRRRHPAIGITPTCVRVVELHDGEEMGTIFSC